MSKKKNAKKKSVKDLPVSKGIERKHLEEFDVTDGKDRSKKEEEIEKLNSSELLFKVYL